MKRVPRSSVLLSLVLLIALSIRVWGIDFGLPYLYHPDEPNKVVMAQRMFKTGDLNPRYFNKPTLFIYLNALTYIPYFLFGKLLGHLSSPTDILAPTLLTMAVGKAPMPTTVLMGRLLTVFFATASVPMVFLIGRQVSSRTSVGLLAALMMAISPTNVANSRHIAVNAFLAFFILVVVWASVRIVQEGRTRDYISAAIAGGLAISSKYPGALVMIVPVIGHFLRPAGRGVRDARLYLMLGLTPVAFLATTPFALLDYERFLEDVWYEATHYSTGHAGMEGNSLAWYLDYMWRSAGVIYLLAALGVVRAVISRSREMILLSVFPLVYFVFISSFVVRNGRTLLPLTPFAFVLAASLLNHVLTEARGLESKALRRLSFSALVCLSVVSLVLPASRTVRQTMRLSTVDSRETARAWIDENLPSGARIAVEAYAPFVDPARFAVQGVGMIIDQQPRWYVENGFHYLVFSEGMYGRFFREPGQYPLEVLQYERFFKRFALVKRFDDAGYEVRIHKVE